MKIWILPLALALVGCAAQQEARRTGVVGPDGRTIIWDQPGSTQYSSVPEYNRTSLDDIKDSIEDLKDQQERDAWDAESRASDIEEQQSIDAEERASH